MPLLQHRYVTLCYSDLPLLDQVDLQVDPGERFCLVGRNLGNKIQGRFGRNSATRRSGRAARFFRIAGRL